MFDTFTFYQYLEVTSENEVHITASRAQELDANASIYLISSPQRSTTTAHLELLAVELKLKLQVCYEDEQRRVGSRSRSSRRRSFLTEKQRSTH